jgi:predicted transcriptional regulator
MHHGTYPTPAELPVLRALWALGTATHGEVLRRLEDAGLIYHSNAPTLLLRSLAAKGLVAREPAPQGTRGSVYAATVDKAEMAAMIVEGL